LLTGDYSLDAAPGLSAWWTPQSARIVLAAGSRVDSPSFEDTPAMKFFKTATRNLVAGEAAAGLRHHVALSVVGIGRLLQSGYLRAKHHSCFRR